MNKALITKITEDLNERMSHYTDSRQPSGDEVSLAACICEIESLTKKAARLEGWLLLLYPAGHHSLDVSDEEEQEIFDYIRELEGK